MPFILYEGGNILSRKCDHLSCASFLTNIVFLERREREQRFLFSTFQLMSAILSCCKSWLKVFQYISSRHRHGEGGRI